jgi:hypothetical protein
VPGGVTCVCESANRTMFEPIEFYVHDYVLALWLLLSTNPMVCSIIKIGLPS